MIFSTLISPVLAQAPAPLPLKVIIVFSSRRYHYVRAMIARVLLCVQCIRLFHSGNDVVMNSPHRSTLPNDLDATARATHKRDYLQAENNLRLSQILTILENDKTLAIAIETRMGLVEHRTCFDSSTWRMLQSGITQPLFKLTDSESRIRAFELRTS